MSKLRPTPRAPGLATEVEEIPLGVRRAAAWSWRLIVVVAAASLLLWGLLQVAGLVVPVLIAILLAALLTPVVKVLTRYTFLGRAAASGIALLGLLLVIAGMFTLAGRQLFAQFADIQDKAVTGFQSLTDWATTTFKIEAPMVDSAIQEGLDKLQENSDQLVSGALGTAAVLGNLVTGILICLFALFFLLSGGSGIWRWVVGLLPPAARVPTHEAFRRGWKALSAYIRTQILVAGVDATGIAIGMIGLGLGSYAVPIWLLVFLFSFIPLVGAIASGAIAVLLVLVLHSWVGAVIMLVIVLAVQQIEGNVLQPFLMGKAVELHPLAVFLGVAGGAMVAGIAGALFSIPLIAFVNATMLYIVGRDPSPELGLDAAGAEHFDALQRRSEAQTAERAAASASAAKREPAPAAPAAVIAAGSAGGATAVASADDAAEAAPTDDAAAPAAEAAAEPPSAPVGTESPGAPSAAPVDEAPAEASSPRTEEQGDVPPSDEVPPPAPRSDDA
ncbi:AI-2E family transporter [Brachybacterium ginsengisoli]|uniref:AI-2E family transporter n=1 Tax=Brachybacterium ginsengisoli TaxID=1331682 RepID=A0A291GVE6_9MICO|nr:AI-2E family transporter [Brachybacterium ginsengisoli]ATG54201.1 AI-2E family transporter [Brachybacterium ginsengisoli]